jgi:hypothetical protein
LQNPEPSVDSLKRFLTTLPTRCTYRAAPPPRDVRHDTSISALRTARRLCHGGVGETIEIRTGQQPALQPSVEQEQVRVSVGANMFVAASTDASDEALKAQGGG